MDRACALGAVVIGTRDVRALLTATTAQYMVIVTRDVRALFTATTAPRVLVVQVDGHVRSLDAVLHKFEARPAAIPRPGLR